MTTETLEKSVVYNPSAPAGQGNLRLWMRKGAPVIILIQYGGWTAIDLYDDYQKPWLRRFYEEGFTVVGLNWRFCDGSHTYQYPTPLEDIDAAIRAAYKQICLFYENWLWPRNTHINVIGFSSGAHLAALWALNRRAYAGEDYDASMVVDSVVCCAGVYDLTDRLMYCRGSAEDDNGDVTPYTSIYIDQLLPGTPPTFHIAGGPLPTPTYCVQDTTGTQAFWRSVASPLTYAASASAQGTRYMLQAGERDGFMEYSTQPVPMYDAMTWDSNDRVILQTYPSIGHEIGSLGAPWYSDIVSWNNSTYTTQQKADWEDRFITIVDFIVNATEAGSVGYGSGSGLYPGCPW